MLDICVKDTEILSKTAWSLTKFDWDERYEIFLGVFYVWSKICLSWFRRFYRSDEGNRNWHLPSFELLFGCHVYLIVAQMSAIERMCRTSSWEQSFSSESQFCASVTGQFGVTIDHRKTFMIFPSTFYLPHCLFHQHLHPAGIYYRLGQTMESVKMIRRNRKLPFLK